MPSRIFTSIDLPEKLKNYLVSLMKRDIYWIKWMGSANLHITLNFLGDLEEAEISYAKQILKETVAEYAPFNLTLSSVRGERDMLWIVLGESLDLDNLQSELKAKFRQARIGKSERRRYIPHILLAKSKTGRPMTWSPQNFAPKEFLADRVNLYESELTPGSATHRLIQSFALGNS